MRKHVEGVGKQARGERGRSALLRHVVFVIEFELCLCHPLWYRPVVEEARARSFPPPVAPGREKVGEKLDRLRRVHQRGQLTQRTVHDDTRGCGHRRTGHRIVDDFLARAAHERQALFRLAQKGHGHDGSPALFWRRTARAAEHIHLHEDHVLAFRRHDLLLCFQALFLLEPLRVGGFLLFRKAVPYAGQLVRHVLGRFRGMTLELFGSAQIQQFVTNEQFHCRIRLQRLRGRVPP